VGSAMAIALVFVYAVGCLVVLEQVVFRGRLLALLLYMVIFLPVYTVFLSFINLQLDYLPLIKLLQISKEVVIYGGLVGWMLLHRNVYATRWKLSQPDYFLFLFYLLVLVFVVVPIGPATVVNKLIYFKSLALIGTAYFLGRNCQFDFIQWRTVFVTIFILTVVAFAVSFFEELLGTHFHSLIGLGKYNFDLYEIKPQGHYGLTWTFEAQGAQKRFGSIFSNPLEFAASILLSFSAALIFLFSVKQEGSKIKYSVLLLLTFFCVVFAFSRASFVAIFGMLIVMALMLKFYRILILGFGAAVIIAFYVNFFADQQVKNYALDTILFRNSSNITHLIEWIEAIESIRSQPEGLGLATSGNAGGVEGDLKIGGENQFLVIGVQLGIVGMVLYLMILITSIRRSWQAFQLATSRADEIVPFVAVTVKFGLLLPMLTANAETYLYISSVSWWMIGYSVSLYQELKLRNA
jgi:O-antigen ligase